MIITTNNTIVIIPAYNEEKSVGTVVRALPHEQVREVIVVNNNSTDQTAEQAAQAGATVLLQPLRGYGNACLKGLEYAATLNPAPDIVVFIDADFSDFPEELPLLVAPIASGEMDMVIGSRVLGKRERGSMTIPQVFGNWLATRLIRWFYGVRFTDLGPFRAIRYDKLVELNMRDPTYGWTVEMQVKAAKHRLRCTEIAVSYRRRSAGVSKVSGTIKGTFLAGYKIIKTIFQYR